MAYTLDIPIALDPADTGLTLEAQLVDTAGANSGAAITTGFSEIGSGNYLWHATAIPDGHRGGVKFQLSGGGALQAFTAINPEEAENTDAKTSTRASQTSVNTVDDFLDTEIADIQARLPAALVSGRIDASVGAMAANVLTAAAINADAITAAKLAADVTTELQSGLATSAALTSAAADIATILAAVDTEVAAIKAKTDSLTFTSAGKVDAKLTGDGLANVLIEASISAGASLTNDTGTQLTALTLPQAIALVLAANAGVLAGAATTTITIKPGGKPSGNTRLSATVDASGNRSALTLKVPD